MSPQDNGFSIRKLAHAAVVVRGLLAEKTGDADQPYRGVILHLTPWPLSQSSQERLIQEKGENSLWVENVPDGAEPSPEEWRKVVGAQVEHYMTAHGATPRQVVLPGLGVLSRQDQPSSDHPELRSQPGAALVNKIALVTGAAGAIGHGVCQGLLEQGCRVALGDLPGERLEQVVAHFGVEFPGRVIGVGMDVTDAPSVAAAFEQTVLAWGGIDIVVVNAGIAHVSALTSLELEAFRRLEKVNVEGTLLTLAEAGRYLAWQATGGDIVLISTKNVFAPGAKFGAYSATKAASHQLARIASLELAEYGVRVNMVAPDAVFSDGEVKSGLWATVGPDRMKARGLDEAGLEEYYRSRNLLKLRVTARHVANAVLFFVTHQTPTTGATIPVDGGLPDATPR